MDKQSTQQEPHKDDIQIKQRVSELKALVENHKQSNSHQHNTRQKMSQPQNRRNKESFIKAEIRVAPDDRLKKTFKDQKK